MKIILPEPEAREIFISWYGPLKIILPDPEAREISISWSVPRPEGSLYILILPSISVAIVFIELNFSRNQETLKETAILGINKTLHTDKWTFFMYF